jgi:uncharacterized protein (DUF924 family)
MGQMTSIGDVLDFWLTEIGEDGWFAVAAQVDEAIRARFLAAWEMARAGGLSGWAETAEGALAFLILTDQFPRNMFRGDPRAFASDAIARDVARVAIARGDDLAVPLPQRVFFYLPFEHSEEIADQHWSVALMDARTADSRDGYPLHARAHRAIIERFGRFPFRNAALSRATTPEEQAFLDEGGYGAIVRSLGG